MSKTAAQYLVEALSQNDVKRISSVAGESYLAVLDALLDYPEIDVITCRQEGGAAFMADAWGKQFNEPGICFVTRGPGVCNASIGVHTAKQDSTPMIVFMGHVRREEMGREAWQEIDVTEMFGGISKWAVNIIDPERIPEIIGKAFKVATSGRPGPVVIGLPEDMLTEIVENPQPITKTPPVIVQSGPSEIAAIKDVLKTAQKPIAIIGGGGWTDKSCANFERFAQSCHLPVTCSVRRQDAFNHQNSCYVGDLGFGPNPALINGVKQADTILVVGARMSEIMTQSYTLFDVPQPKQKIIHVYPNEDEIGSVYKPHLGFVASINEFTDVLADKGLGIDGRAWAGWQQQLRKHFEDWTAVDTKNQPDWNGVNMTLIFDYLRNALPADSIITTDAGNFSGWAQRYLNYGRPGRLFAPTSGAMGYGVPSAVAASIANPDKLALGICGDGGFMMNGQELATAMHHNAKPIIMICNNNIYGSIRMHQEKEYPGRHSATDLTNPDFVALAKSYGAHAARVENTSEFEAVWQDALAADKLAVIEVKMDPRQITTQASL